MSMESKYIWMNGELVEFEKATVHLLTPALHYGVGVFEGIRCYPTINGPAVFRNKEHVRRLFNSASILGFREMPFTEEEIQNAIKLTVSVNGFESCYIRPLVYLDADRMGLSLDYGKASIGIAAWEWGNYLGEKAFEEGVRANVSSFTRLHPNVLMTKAKVTGNYANSVLAKTDSLRLGFDECIMLDPQGYVAECSGENLFMARNGVIYTSPTAAILEGITRDAMLKLFGDMGLKVEERPISRDQLYIADEIFLCGTAAECIGLREIDFRKIGDGKVGPITRTMQKVFQQVIRGEHPRCAEWMDYLSTPVESKVVTESRVA
jgi:branched-chain amino acid aminotransferase